MLKKFLKKIINQAKNNLNIIKIKTQFSNFIDKVPINEFIFKISKMISGLMIFGSFQNIPIILSTIHILFSLNSQFVSTNRIYFC